MDMIEENIRRNNRNHTVFNPLTGEVDILERDKFHLPDFYIPTQHLPLSMFKVKLIKLLKKYGSIKIFIESYLGLEYTHDLHEEVSKKIINIRIKYDFCFWAIFFAHIKDKEGEKYIPFKLNAGQRKLLKEMESQRTGGSPIRIILLKARQWGGSTLVQMYMAWIQLVHKKNWNSVICAHLKDSSANIKGMYSKLLEMYPYDISFKEPLKFVPFERMFNTSVIKQTGCRVTIGSAESPESVRGADAAMAHLSEVAFYPKTKENNPTLLIRSICGTILRIPYTVIVLESTANGTGDYFHTEWEKSKKGESDKKPVFVPWFEVELYREEIPDIASFAKEIYENRNNEKGKYFWFLWEKGATLENIYWYKNKLKEYPSHAAMMAEYPTDDIEAFQNTGEAVFDRYQIEKIRERCKDPVYIGEIYGKSHKGRSALSDIRFSSEESGNLYIWQMPDNTRITNRYVTVVDVGGRSGKSDFSVIAVFDRYWMMFGGIPEVVAQWRGHIDHDLLTWKSAQIARFYNNSLLVIESNTLETENTDGEHTEYILDELSGSYSNLYARNSSETIRENVPVKWGFHTNRSTKTMIINHFISILREQDYVEKDTMACDEMRCYEKKSNGSFGAIEGKHDDILMTRMIGLYVCYDIPLPKETNKKRANISIIINESTI